MTEVAEWFLSADLTVTSGIDGRVRFTEYDYLSDLTEGTLRV
jgi:hypothetical protein